MRKSPAGCFEQDAAGAGRREDRVGVRHHVNALKPPCSTRLMRPVKPSIFEWSHETGKTIGVSNSTPKS